MNFANNFPHLFRWMQSIGLIGHDEPTHCGVDPNTFMPTTSGREIDLLNPDASAIEITDIAHCLAKIDRFNGAAMQIISVAEHSMHCADECALRYPGENLARFACLMHDGHEYLCHDLTRPYKRAAGTACRRIEYLCRRAVERRFGIDRLSAYERAIVKEIDNACLMAEALRLMRGAGSWNWGDTEPARTDWQFCEKPWRTVRDNFLTEFEWLYRAAFGRRFGEAA